MTINIQPQAPHPPAKVTPERIMQFAFGYAPALILQAALHHRVFDVLQETPKTVEQVSEATGASIRGLRALLNPLVALELLSKDDAQRYSLTPESSTFLVSTKPSYFGGLLNHTIHGILPQWIQLPEIVQTGKPAMALNQETTGGDYFEAFVPSLFPLMYPSAEALANVLNLSQLQQPTTVLDLAAGSGVWGIALAKASPQIRVSAIDWAEVISVTQRMTAQQGVNDRFQFIAGDLLTVEFGKDYQIATLGHILHSEGEKRSRQLLAKVFEVLAPGGTIAIAEWLPNRDRRSPLNALIFAVNMLVLTDEGDTFSVDEIGSWLHEVGFTDVRTVPVPAPFPLILATKPHALAT